MSKRHLVAVGVAIAVALAASPLAAKTPPGSLPGKAEGRFRIGSTEYTPTGQIAFASQTPCPPMDGSNPRVEVAVTTGLVHRSTEVRLDAIAPGQWSGAINLDGQPPLPLGPGLVGAMCQSGEGDSLVVSQIYPPINMIIVPGPPVPLPPLPATVIPRLTG